MLNFAKKVVTRGPSVKGGDLDASGERGMPVVLADCVGFKRRFKHILSSFGAQFATEPISGAVK
jgi:hypothetical protein